MYHDSPSQRQFLAVPRFGGPKIWRETRTDRDVPAAGASTVPTTPGSRGAAPTRSPRPTPAPIQLLLRARRLPQENDSAVGALPRPKGLPQPSSSFWSPPCGTAPHRAGSASCPNTSAPIAAPSHAGRSSGANSSPARPSGRSRALVWRPMSTSPRFPSLSSTPSSATARTATAGSGCSASSLRSRSREACGSSSPEDRLRSADDAPSAPRTAGRTTDATVRCTGSPASRGALS